MFNYKLPGKDLMPIIHNTESNSLIIIGANGSGKSKLGAWIEQQDMGNVHRVGAQRSLDFGDYIQLKSYEQAGNLLFYGQDTKEIDKHGRWSYHSDGQRFTTQLLNDYENVLAALIAMKNNQNDAFINDCKERESRGEQHNKTPETVVDSLKRIWKNVFPQRDIDFEDAKITAILSRPNTQPISYKGNKMSDGERVGLYLIAQCLCIPENKTIIIDEPEIHLHRSIMNRLWAEIEKSRPDSFFIYITHDTQFAAQHRQAKKIWVKSFDGEKWDLEEIPESELPEQLLLDIIGNRKKVIFVEGTSGSYDTKLYSEIYKDYYVVPCGGCQTVISQVKTMRNTKQLHDMKCYGIIDRDYRNDNEIVSLKEHDIFVIDVAEVENLFLVEELLNIVNEMQFPQDKTRSEQVKNIIKSRYEEQRERQICEAVKSEIKYRLSTVEVSGKNDDEIKRTLKSTVDSINYDTIRTEIERKFNSASASHRDILKVFNCKSLTRQISESFGLMKNTYCDFIIRQLSGEKAEEIKDALASYLPDEIPR